MVNSDLPNQSQIECALVLIITRLVKTVSGLHIQIIQDMPFWFLSLAGHQDKCPDLWHITY